MAQLLCIYIVFSVMLLIYYSKQLAKDLWTAVSDGNEHEVKRLLESGADPDHSVYWSAEWPSLPPLHAACSESRLCIVQVLVELGGARINRGDKQHNKTPLHWAMEKLTEDIVTYLLKSGECDLSECCLNSSLTACAQLQKLERIIICAVLPVCTA